MAITLSDESACIYEVAVCELCGDDAGCRLGLVRDAYAGCEIRERERGEGRIHYAYDYANALTMLNAPYFSHTNITDM